MNFLKKTWVAIALTVIMVVAAIGVGQLRAPVPGLPTDTSNSASGALDTSLSTSEYDTWISDQAGVRPPPQRSRSASITPTGTIGTTV